MKSKSIVLILALVCSSPLFAVESREIFSVPWGASGESLGLIDLPEMEKAGPLSFALDARGEIYVCDGVNRCVKRYDAEGRYLGIAAADAAAHHVAVDSEGVVYARVDGGRIEVFEEGRRTGGFQVPSNVPLIEGYEQAIGFSPSPSGDASEAISVNDPLQRNYPVVSRTASGLAATGEKEIRATAGSAVYSATGFAGYYRPEWKEPQRGWLHAYDALGELVRSIPIETQDRLGSLIFKGADLKGRLYLETERIDSTGWAHLEIRIYAPSGRLLETYEIPNDYYTTVYRKTWLKPDGAIVQMITRPEGASFLEWK